MAHRWEKNQIKLRLCVAKLRNIWLSKTIRYKTSREISNRRIFEEESLSGCIYGVTDWKTQKSTSSVEFRVRTGETKTSLLLGLL